MSDEDCERDLVRCRDRTAPGALAALDQIRKRQKILDLEDEVERVHKELVSRQSAFKPSPKARRVPKTILAVDVRCPGPVSLSCSSRRHTAGKDLQRNVVMGNIEDTQVSCGNCGPGVLPSVSAFDRHLHDAVLFDEVRPDQVLQNRELFQSNQYVQTLGQSPCNPYAYSIWVYHAAMILCANSFNIESEDLSEGDQKWLQGNMMILSLPEGEKWYESKEETI